VCWPVLSVDHSRPVRAARQGARRGHRSAMAMTSNAVSRFAIRRVAKIPGATLDQQARAASGLRGGGAWTDAGRPAIRAPPPRSHLQIPPLRRSELSGSAARRQSKGIALEGRSSHACHPRWAPCVSPMRVDFHPFARSFRFRSARLSRRADWPAGERTSRRSSRCATSRQTPDAAVGSAYCPSR